MLKRVKIIQVQDNGDFGSMIVGEWGVTGSDSPDALTSLYSQIIQNSWLDDDQWLPDIMFYFSHHIQDETDYANHPDDKIIWGFRRYDFFTRMPDESQVRYKIETYSSTDNIDQDSRILRNRYASLFHGQALNNGQ